MTEGIAAAVSPQDKKRDSLAKARAVQAANREAAQQEAAGLGVSAARAAQAPGSVVGRTERGRVIVIGRDGKPISRAGDQNIDKYAIPPNEIPNGWGYQWIAETVLNEPQTAAMLQFKQAGWTFVPQERHPNNPVRQGGLALVERPQPLIDEARQDEMQQASDQVRANVEQFAPPGGLQKTGRIRKGRPVSVSADGVPEPVLEVE
jgi:hypothetical protein